MSDRFQELMVFVRAAETASFSAAAKELGLSQPSVSRIVSELETRLGTRLLLRSTRRMVPTDAGHAFLQSARQILFDLEEADQTAMGLDSLTGMLRVAMPSILAVRIVLPVLQQFLEQHPRLKVELLTSDSMHDLVAEGADMAVRFGKLEDSSFGSNILGVEQRWLIASPAYLEAMGSPQSPQDLPEHYCICGPGGSSSPSWTFNREDEQSVVKISPRIRVASADAIIAGACAGLGITLCSAWMCKAEIDSGQLVRVLPHWSLATVQAHAVYPAGRAPSMKVRRFSTFLSQVIAAL
ncbi:MULTISPECIES: LysR family transcriptional regulator [unclassified Pseudomonas]|uniref:LysR family transcriptional regulator n=1 Tax=unclassified Pseudomonas TaxID=196821 RepID=UPI002AC99B2E|nr:MULTISPECIES: LysR family transcriptional regulator [unclassified Pseudomonas]MEB0040069.1 LysR family transcriptional regulator [Pseudomonas sp. MH10]MEB0122322.1 LysR family transcriptional regulator [Pseudomonas sp. CCI1.2]WPX65412.1 LysR family transcriptional regulator [Pseudomonas sp. MH10]